MFTTATLAIVIRLGLSTLVGVNIAKSAYKHFKPLKKSLKDTESVANVDG